VWFLAGTVGLDPVVRECTIPGGKALFFTEIIIGLLIAFTSRRLLTRSVYMGDTSEENAAQPADCLDVTPHEVTFVTVEPGVQLEVLDFGGTGAPMVLLTGIGDNAHVWDGFAYQFTDFFRDIGITRRGYGRSDQPDDGYDVRTRARDDIAVLDHFGIDKAVFVGHSVAGAELSQLGLAYPGRVDKLVYLDPQRARPDPDREDPPGPPFTDDDLRSLRDYQAANARFQGHRAPNAALCNDLLFSPSGRVLDSVTPPEIGDKILADIGKQRPTNWRRIRAPRLGIFATFRASSVSRGTGT
jgi:non-heme chloroperoxidase